jgi:hypothetical protein
MVTMLVSKKSHTVSLVSVIDDGKDRVSFKGWLGFQSLNQRPFERLTTVRNSLSKSAHCYVVQSEWKCAIGQARNSSQKGANRRERKEIRVRRVLADMADAMQPVQFNNTSSDLEVKALVMAIDGPSQSQGNPADRRGSDIGS